MSDNLTEYIAWRGDLTFEQSPFTLLDEMVFCEVAYFRFESVIPGDTDCTLREIITGMAHFSKELLAGVGDVAAFEKMIRCAAESRRFGDLAIVNRVSRLDHERGVQFSAVTYLLPDDRRYIAFRGTDDSIVGWKEDFMISYVRTPGQDAALNYVREALEMPGEIYVGGHSKGANFALFAAAMLSAEERTRIREIDILDGPGLCPDVLGEHHLEDMSQMVARVIPVYSVIGKLFEPKELKTQIVKSDASGIMQHDMLSWQVNSSGLDLTDRNEPGSEFLNRAFDEWIERAGMDERQEFVETLFDTMLRADYHSLTDISERGPAAFENIVLSILIRSRGGVMKTGIRLPLQIFFGSAWDRLKTSREGIDRALSGVWLPKLVMIVCGILLVLMPQHAFQYFTALGIFGLAGFESVIAVRELSASKWDFRGSQTRIKIALVMIGMAVVITVKENALYIVGSLAAGLACILFGTREIGTARSRLEAGRAYAVQALRAGIYILEGVGILIIPEDKLAGAVYALGFLLILDGGLSAIARINYQKSTAVREFAMRIPFVSMFVYDSNFRNIVMLAISAALNVMFALMYLIPGIIIYSKWMIFIGCFQALCGVVRFLLSRDARKEAADVSAAASRRNFARIRTAIFIFAMSVSFCGITYLSITRGYAYMYPGFWIYMICLVTMCRWVMMIIFSLRDIRRREFPVRENSAIRLCGTLVSVYAMQTALLAAFSDSAGDYAMRANAITGGIIFILMVSSGIGLLVHRYRDLTHAGEEKI